MSFEHDWQHTFPLRPRNPEALAVVGPLTRRKQDLGVLLADLHEG
jgi:hypothetical protein